MSHEALPLQECPQCGERYGLHHDHCSVARERSPVLVDDKLTDSICRLACAIRELAEVVAENKNQSVLNRLEEMEKNIMSAIGDWAAKNGPKLDKIQTGLDTVQALVEKLQNSPGAITPEDQALLDQIDAKIDAIATDADSVPAPPSA